MAPHFDGLYADDRDPWRVATSWYERRKIDLVLACLRRPRYRMVWDAGCGTGELTAALIARADHALATDLSREAVGLTRARLADPPTERVVVEHSTLPHRPTGLAQPPDLIVLSEVLYYLTPQARGDTYALIDEVAAPEADVVIAHWGPQADHARSSGLSVFNEATQNLNERGWGRIVTHIDAEFYIGLFSKDVPSEVGGRDT